MAEETYGAIQFGEFRKYMNNKQAKLKNQQQELKNLASQERAPLFKGLSIHINGYTNPPNSELRRLILEYGGDYQHYLKPEWITESIEAERLLPWQPYRLVISGQALNQDILSNQWARSTSTVNPQFIKRYYETSRLHYLSVWKGELKDIVDTLQEKYPAKTTPHGPRVIMHIDFDCFFASVGIKDRPHLRDQPVAVSHGSGKESSSDIASCNYVARSFGIHNGMTIGTAMGLCPNLQIIPYEFEKYRSISEIFYEASIFFIGIQDPKIVFQHALEMQAVSVDEALLEIEGNGQEEHVATTMRNEIRQATGCEASIGIGKNILLARLSTKKAKPAGQFYCKEHDVEPLLAETSVTDLPGVGYAIAEKLKELDVQTVLDVRKIPLTDLQTKLGAKMGQTLFQFSRGLDDRVLTRHKQRQSVSAEVNWGVRFENDLNEKEFVQGLSKEVSDRLIKHGLKGKTITIKILKRKHDAVEASKHLGHGQVDSFSKSTMLSDYTNDSHVIFKSIYPMLKGFQFSCSDIRGLGIQITRLDNIVLSPDQGTLKFKSATTAETTSTSSSSSNTREMTKAEMTVDYNVYKELPELMQQELASNYTLVFQNNAQPVEELPPWSQLDPTTLLALPKEMQEQVLQAYGNKSSPPPTVPLQMNGLDYDVNVWNALPEDVRTELLEEHCRNQPTEKKPIEILPAMVSPPSLPLLSEPEGEPALNGCTDLKEIRSLLRDWVSLYEDGPEPEDVEKVIDLLTDLIDGSDIEKVRLIVLYLDYLTRKEKNWKQQMNTVKETVQRLTCLKYGYPLAFY
ncbi:hypothetical protein INT47_005394 [Mucor saturninus]|uniref:DNA repair protein REV1 n=1 Tax=Mucor saturninus TaxID=64648 RepID=A0A8H7QU54_9FUNG|nr:hypothetical protein INT47_005394 [Mucor saturninus]